MCGIAGIYNPDNRKINKNTLEKMSLAIKHRGPDAKGIFLYQNVGLANRRLAIIDLSDCANQPMTSADGNCCITYNGEIYNYQDIMNELIIRGYKFKSKSDTETILNGYIEYGPDIVKKLIGQYAFCIWDSKKKRLILARDSVGINPLYYSSDGKSFLFASEIKSLLASGFIKREINTESLHHFLSMFVVPAPFTMIKSIKSLPPGHVMMVDKSGITIDKFYGIPVGLWRNNRMTESQLSEILENTIYKAVTSSSVSDVPVGAFLSGGIDSSAITALLSKKSEHPVKTFSLWSDDGAAYDERKYARLVSGRYHTEHYEYNVSEKEVIKELPKIIYYFDQPTGGSFENYFVSKIAHSHVKVALSGLGGDELFAGYHSIIYQTKIFSDLYKYMPVKLLKIINYLADQSPLGRDTKKTIKVANEFLKLPNAIKKRLYIYFAFNENCKRNLYHPRMIDSIKDFNTEKYFENIIKDVKSQDATDQLSYLDLMTYTRDDLLTGTNMMSMASSLEVRVPLLDTRLINFSSEIPPKYKYNNGISKYIFRKVMKKYLPHEVLNHKKTGFGLPRVRYMRNSLKPYIETVLTSRTFRERELFNQLYVKNLVNDFYSEKNNRMLWNEHLRIWILFIFELWCRLYIDNKNICVPSVSLKELSDL